MENLKLFQDPRGMGVEIKQEAKINHSFVLTLISGRWNHWKKFSIKIMDSVLGMLILK